MSNVPVNKLCFVHKHIAHEQFDKSTPKIMFFTLSYDRPTNLQRIIDGLGLIRLFF